MNLDLTLEEIDNIMQALATRPYVEVYKVINNIGKQVQEQKEKQDGNGPGNSNS